jgi:hypothetical protein
MTVTAASGGRQSSAVVNGRAQNTGERSIVSATITADFFDENGKFIHSGSTTYGNLAPGEIWEFAVEITNADAWKITKYTVKTNVSQ